MTVLRGRADAARACASTAENAAISGIHLGTWVERMPDKSKKKVADILAAARKADAKGDAPAQSDGDGEPAEAAHEVMTPPAAAAGKTSSPTLAKTAGGGSKIPCQKESEQGGRCAGAAHTAPANELGNTGICD